jgi:hypothetical protein
MKASMLHQENQFRPIGIKDLRAAPRLLISEGKDLRAAASSNIAEAPAPNLFIFDA